MSRTGKPRNLSDLAELAGVTKSAASLALHNSPQLSDELKQRICTLAKVHNFTPRKYNRRVQQNNSSQTAPFTGRVLMVHYSSEEEDTVNIELENAIINRLNTHHVPFQTRDLAEILENPDLLHEYAGVIYYFDPPGLIVPREIPRVQIFGLERLAPGHDRVTTNDEEIALLAVDFLLRVPLRAAALVYREDMIRDYYHPRIQYFKHRLRELGVEYLELMYRRDEEAFPERVRTLAEQFGDKLGFFAFGDICALRLYLALNEIGIWKRYATDRVICGDTTRFLRNFWPQEHLIELQLEELARRAVDQLLWKLQTRNSYGATIMLEARLIEKK